MRTPRWNRDFATRLLADHVSSGLTLKAFAQQRKLPLKRLEYWRYELREKRPGPLALLPVRVRDEATSKATAVTIVLRGARELRVHAGFDEATLLRVVSLLEGA